VESEPGASVYLYGIVRWPVPARIARSLGPGVCDPPAPLRVVRHQGLAALVSDVHLDKMSGHGVRGLRRDMKAHAALLNRAATQMAVLPVRFGVALPDQQRLVEYVLQPQYRRLEDYLVRVGNAVEVTFKATYVEQEVLREAVAARPELGRSAARGTRASSYQSRLELGHQIAATIRELKDRDSRWLVRALAPAVKDANIREPSSDLMVLNASFLVDRNGMPRFDQALEAIKDDAGERMQLECVGPLPPYSFVDLRIQPT
jgi:hypothetical protein